MDKMLNNLGLCARARGLVSGADIVIDGLRHNKVFLIFLASDASENTKKKINDKATYYGCEVISNYSSSDLSIAIGKSGRMVLGITDKNFLKILKK